MLALPTMVCVMSQWHPPVETAEHWRAHYERWRDIHGPNSLAAHRLRRSISMASRSEQVTEAQRNELLAVLVQIDDEGLGR